MYSLGLTLCECVCVCLCVFVGVCEGERLSEREKVLFLLKRKNPKNQ